MAQGVFGARFRRGLDDYGITVRRKQFDGGLEAEEFGCA
jgi:hypothetical protein